MNDHWLIVLICGLLLAVIYLSFKLVCIKESLEDLNRQLGEKLEESTNTPLSVQIQDQSVRQFVSTLNRHLNRLRKKEIVYEKGDSQLKETLSGMAHDLRTPLTAIHGYLELIEALRRKGREESDLLNQSLEKPAESGSADLQKVWKYMDIITDRVDYLMELSRDLFLYTTIMTPERKRSLIRLDLRQTLEESLIGMYAEFDRRHIIPEIHIPDQPVWRVLDLQDLQRIFCNLLTNACKYSKGDLVVELNSSGDIIFSNYAPDLNAVDIYRIFQRFFTVESRSHSTGLGLAIAKELTEQMNGRISADFTAGRLSILLPFPETQSKNSRKAGDWA